MKLIQTLLKRLVYSVLLLGMVILFNFFLLHLAPGDPVDVLVGEMGGADEEVIAQLRSDYGLDKSLGVQLGRYFWRMAHGDLGMSYSYNQPVMEMIMERLPPSLLLMMVSITSAIFLGIFMGTFAAQNPNGTFSHFVTFLALAGYSAPAFWTGIMLLITFTYLLPWFPSYGMSSVGFLAGPFETALDIAHHLVLPAITLASIYLAYYSRLSRASMLDVMGSDYIRTAWAKGLSRRSVVYKHALKNAVLPVVTIAGLQFSQLVAGAVVVVTNVVTDLSYRFLDPRIK